MLTRGIRNNNPANIRRSSSRWRGLAEDGSLAVPYDKEFCQFVSIEFGVRAFLCLLRTYINKYNVRSIVQFVHRFAPATDGNNEYAYCCHICKNMNKRLRLCINPNDNVLNDGWSTGMSSKRLPVSSSFLFEFCRAVFLIESDYELSPIVFECAYNML